MTHPAQFSPKIIAALDKLLAQYGIERVFDPFAGPGVRLGALCDAAGITFAGCDIEDWGDYDHRVKVADATLLDPETLSGWWVVTSPTYANGINDHFEPTDNSQRYTYRVALGRALHENNTGRYSIRGGKKAWDMYWKINAAAVERWMKADGVIVNVKDFIAAGREVPLSGMWRRLLEESEFEVVDTLHVITPGLLNGANREARADGEWLIIAKR